MSSFIIKTPREFSFRQSLYFLNRSPHELLHVTHDGQVEKIIHVGEKTILFSVMEHQPQQLVVNILNHRAAPGIQEALHHYIEEWFDLKTDLKPFYRLAEKDPLLKPLVKKYFGYRIVSMPDLFESLCWAIIGQQINLTFAYRLKQKFVHEFGAQFSRKGITYYHFPLPETIATLEPVSLLALQFSRQKADYIITLAMSFASGIISKEKLTSLSFHDAKQALINLKGIGNWTANYVLMKTFHYPNAFPVEDAGLHQAIRKQLSLKEKPTVKMIEQLFENYKGWEAYATLYLWRSLSNG